MTAFSRTMLAGASVLGAMYVSRGEPTASVGQCEFENEPTFPGYFWDPSCEIGQEGCQADGKNVECRFCGGGDFSVPCPPSSCHFPNDPFMPYYWDPTCEMGMLGCWADGIHAQCRFCGDHPFTSIPCPAEVAAVPNGASCAFGESEPETPTFWDPSCQEGVFGCKADGVHVQCRFCGKGEFAEIRCPASEVCSFAHEPSTPYYWDSEGANGKLGCLADGIHPECRFCGKRPFEEIPCPGPIAPPTGQCIWPMRGEPSIGYFWDETCANGMLGCWADGMHAECRFCGSGVFAEIPCPEGGAAAGGVAAAASKYDAATASQVFMRQESLQASTSAARATPAKDMPASAAKDMNSETMLNGCIGLRSKFGALLALVGIVTAVGLQ